MNLSHGHPAINVELCYALHPWAPDYLDIYCYKGMVFPLPLVPRFLPQPAPVTHLHNDTLVSLHRAHCFL